MTKKEDIKHFKALADLKFLFTDHVDADRPNALKNGKLYLGTMVPKQAEIASYSIFGYHNLIKAKPL